MVVDTQGAVATKIETRAARLYEAGAPLRVEEVELAGPGAGEVAVRLDYAGVNPLDTYAAAGLVGDLSRLPRTLGVEGTGWLAGGAGHLSAAGQRVVVHGGGIGLTRDGTFAGAVVVDRQWVTPVPEGIEPTQAAGLGVAGVTAWRVVCDLGRVGAADRVLVTGAAGGVGGVAVQLAKIAGAEVWGQVGSPAKLDAVEQLGVDRAVATHADALADAVAEFEPTVVVDGLGGPFLAAAAQTAAPHARLVTFGASAGMQVSLDIRGFYRKGLTLLGYGGIREPAARLQEALESVAALAAAGRVHIPVARVLPLGRVHDAFTLLAERAVVGKVVLDVRT